MQGDPHNRELASRVQPGKNNPPAPGPGQPFSPPYPEGTWKTPRAICTFGSQRILPLIEAFAPEIEGVKHGDDIEHLHQMRVASRRLRAALRTFRPCFPEKKYRKYFAETRNITRALGQARDADVQIVFLKKVRKRLSKPQKDNLSESQDEPTRLRLEAIQYLITKFRRDRARYQKNVIQALEKFEKQGQPDAIRTSISLFAPASRQRRSNPSALTFLSCENIGACISELFAFEPWLQYPDAIAEHHAMRIAAKHLRYTMEVFAPIYRLGLKKYLVRVARLQQMLGDLHDTDVWITIVSELLLRERSRPRAPGDQRRPGPAVIGGLKLFLQDREKERAKLFRRIVQYWNLLARMDLWEDLKKETIANQKARYRTHIGMLPEEARKDQVWRYANIYPQGMAHSLQVTHLALQIFDQLQAVHNLSQQERSLLEYGAILHDIGWKSGKQGHAKRSAEMIYAEENLPFTQDARGTIGLLAYSHRGKDRFGKSGYFGLLPPEQQQTILILAGILRVADGLDGMHRSRISSVRCEVTPGRVTCTAIASADCEEEISMAKKKADVLEKALGLSLQVAKEATPEAASPGIAISLLPGPKGG